MQNGRGGWPGSALGCGAREEGERRVREERRVEFGAAPTGNALLCRACLRSGAGRHTGGTMLVSSVAATPSTMMAPAGARGRWRHSTAQVARTRGGGCSARSRHHTAACWGFGHAEGL